MLDSGPINQIGEQSSYSLATWVFLRLLGLIYLIAFFSLAVQVRGLVGTNGILPAREFLTAQRSGKRSWYYRIPTLCWWIPGDTGLMFLSWGGVALSCFLLLGLAPVMVLTLLWAFYLSLFKIGRVFLGYQWDVLLLEVGFLSIFLTPPKWLDWAYPAYSPVIRWLLCWTLFRLMFSSGMAKLLSADATWRRLTALRHHYETQPLPTVISWYAHQLPCLFHRISAGIMFGIEVFVPFLIFGPTVLRPYAAFLFIFLMVLIQLTGNYGFFNLLAIALSILLLDDDWLAPVIGPWLQKSASPASLSAFFYLSFPVALLIGVLSIEPMLRLFRLDLRHNSPLDKLFAWFAPFQLVNSYGLFSVMTTERPEIQIEGSVDGETWKTYRFKWKPGEMDRAPRFVAPFQPRLDWQMWFAAQGYYPNHPWFQRLLLRLLENAPQVTGLLATNPFPQKPPRYIRAVMFDYRFTSWQERSLLRAWWVRIPRGQYSPTLERRTETS